MIVVVVVGFKKKMLGDQNEKKAPRKGLFLRGSIYILEINFLIGFPTLRGYLVILANRNARNRDRYSGLEA